MADAIYRVHALDAGQPRPHGHPVTEDARKVIEDGIRQSVFPGATVEVGDSTGSRWRDALGHLTFDEGSAPTAADTPFDLASLTKPLATTTAAMNLVHAGRLRLDERIGDVFDDWRGRDREAVTVRDLLEHAAGLPGRLIDPAPLGRREFEHDICTMRLEYPPRTASIYSDLGFLLLGFLVADRGGASLAAQFDEMLGRLGVRAREDTVREAAGLSAMNVLTFALPREARKRAAPTRPMETDLRRGRMLAGEVHDDYAAALGGVAGHAGLFGSAGAVGAFARLALKGARGNRATPFPLSPGSVALMTARSLVPGSSRALGWDTMLPTSSCGSRMSASAFGHVGFTGTSLWIDPARDRYFVLLTNRVCGDGSLEQMRSVRRAFHDALGDF